MVDLRVRTADGVRKGRRVYHLCESVRRPGGRIPMWPPGAVGAGLRVGAQVLAAVQHLGVERLLDHGAHDAG